MRIPLPTSLKTRTGAPDKDPRMTNCYVEIKGNDAIMRKRPGLSDLTSSVICIGQGGIQTDNGAVFFNCDQISTAVNVTQDYTVTNTDVIVDVCGNVAVTMPPVPRADQTIAITNVCGGTVTVPNLPVTVSIEPMIFGTSYDAFAVGTAYKWTASGGFVPLDINGAVTGASADGNIVIQYMQFASKGQLQDIEGADDNIISLAGATNTTPYAISARSNNISNNSFVCGEAVVGGNAHAFVYTPAGGAVDITPAATSATALSISDDGIKVLVYADGVNYIWTLAGGLVSLGLPAGYVAIYLSGDGNIVIGLTGTGDGFVRNITAATTTIITGEIPEVCSTDGAIIVSTPAGRAHITLRTLGGNTVINQIAGYHTFNEFYISADGSIIAGICMQNVTSNSTGFIWTATSGIVDFGGIGAYHQNNVGAIAGGNVTLALTGDIKTGTQVDQIVPSQPAPTAKPIAIVPRRVATFGSPPLTITKSVSYQWNIGSLYYIAYSDGTYSTAY